MSNYERREEMKVLVAVLMLVGLGWSQKPVSQPAINEGCKESGDGTTLTCPSFVPALDPQTVVGIGFSTYPFPHDSFTFVLPSDWTAVNCRKRTRRQVHSTIVLTASVPNEVTKHPICMVPKALLPKESK